MMERIEYAFIVDTDAYSGNFERQMCAYITGLCGECGQGREIAEKAYKALGKTAEWFEANVISKTDDHGCFRPVAMHPTPNFYNDGMGGAYDDSMDKDFVYKRYVKAVEDYRLPLIAEAEKKIAAGEKGWKPTLLAEKEIIEASKKNGPGKCPSYQSIIVYLTKPPPQNIRKIIIKRANEFANDPGKCGEKWAGKFKILDIRFIKEKTVVTEESI